MKASSGLARLPELALRQRRQGLAQQLPPVSEILRGSLVERYVTCGNPACKCAKGQRHGPQWYLTVTPGTRAYDWRNRSTRKGGTSPGVDRELPQGQKTPGKDLRDQRELLRQRSQQRKSQHKHAGKA